MEADFSNSSSPPFIPKHIQSLETRGGGLGSAGPSLGSAGLGAASLAASMVSSSSAGSSVGGAGAAYHGMPITDTQVNDTTLGSELSDLVNAPRSPHSVFILPVSSPTRSLFVFSFVCFCLALRNSLFQKYLFPLW